MTVTRRHAIFGGLAMYGLAGSALAQDQINATTAIMPPHIVSLRNEQGDLLPPGEIHVIPDQFRLYWTLPDGKAWVYPIRVGRDELYVAGSFYVGAKKEWPSWMPTPGMLRREPELYGPYAEDGIEGGPGNPLGARALYLFREGQGDTFLRIHGTDDPRTIGQSVSNGCAGLTNEHIVHLYDRVPLETRVVLYPKMGSDAFVDG